MISFALKRVICGFGMLALLMSCQPRRAQPPAPASAPIANPVDARWPYWDVSDLPHDWSAVVDISGTAMATEAALAQYSSSGSADWSARFLPWPPPAPSRMDEISDRISTRGTFGDIAERLRDRLRPRGYDTLLYFRIERGIAITTEVERISETGDPADPRWVLGKVGGYRGIVDYARRLIWGEQGRFRILAFMVTPVDVSPASYSATQEDVARWKSTGSRILPGEVSEQRAPRGTRIYLLIYEFTSNRSRSGGIAATEAALPLSRHLASLGL